MGLGILPGFLLELPGKTFARLWDDKALKLVGQELPPRSFLPGGESPRRMKPAREEESRVETETWLHLAGAPEASLRPAPRPQSPTPQHLCLSQSAAEDLSLGIPAGEFYGHFSFHG